MNGLSSRLAALAAALVVTVAVTSGVLGYEPASSLVHLLPEGAGADRELPLTPPSTVLVCPGAPRLAETGPTDEEFEAEAELSTSLLATASTSAALTGVLATSGGDDGAAPPPPDVETAGDLQILESKRTEPATLTAAAAAGPEPSSDPALLSALRTSHSTAGDLRGLAASSCVAPASRSYLVGGAVQAGRSDVLQLSNPGRTTATVDLRVLTDGGPVDPAAGKDLSLAPGDVREVLIGGLVQDEPVIAVEVDARGGEVAALMTDSQLRGVVPLGVEVVPSTSAVTSAVIPGLVTGAGPVTLRLAVPGTEPAVVTWRVEGAEGVLAPTGESVVSVQPGHVVDVPVEGLGRGRANVVLESDEPVAATAEVVLAASVALAGAGEQAAERAYAVPASAVTDTALVTLPQEPVTTHLVLSGGDSDAEGLLTPIAPDGRTGSPVTLDLVDGAATVVPSDELEGARAVRLTVASGAVFAAQVLTVPSDDDGASVLASIVPVTVAPPVQRTVHVDVVEPGRWP